MHHRRRVPATRDESAEERLLGRALVDVDRLQVLPLGKPQYRLAVHRPRAEGALIALGQVFEVQSGRRLAAVVRHTVNASADAA